MGSVKGIPSSMMSIVRYSVSPQWSLLRQLNIMLTSTTVLQTKHNIDSLLCGRVSGGNVGHQGRPLLLLALGECLLDVIHIEEDRAGQEK